MKPPTKRQREVMATIEGFTEKNGYPPTVRELGALLGIASANAVSDHLKLLKRKGLVDWKRGSGRTLRVTDPERAADLLGVDLHDK